MCEKRREGRGFKETQVSKEWRDMDSAKEREKAEKARLG